MRGPRRLRLAGVLLAVVGCGAAGCGGLPVGHGIHVERSVVVGDLGAQVGGAQDVRVLPPGPAAGATPAEIVRGFLNAQSDSEDDFGIARDYLAPDTAWNTAGPVTVYGSVTAGGPPPRGAGASVTVRLDRTAGLDAAGVYTPRDDTVSQFFPLALVGSSWRITAVPAGLELTNGDLLRSYAPSTLWWAAARGRFLVPEVRWLPSAVGGVATQLVRALLSGPSPALAASVRPAIPAGLALDGSVSTDGPGIVVDLSQQAATLSTTQAHQLLLELGRTLEPITTATTVRLQVDGQQLLSANASQPLPLSEAAAADPDSVAPQSPPVVLTAAGRIAALEGSLPATVAPAAEALRGRALLAVVPAPAGGELAALVRVGARQQVLVASSGETGPATVTALAPPGAYATPSWSLDGTLVAATPGGLVVRSPGRPAVTVAYPPGLTGPVTGARIAADGVRVLLTAGPAGRGVGYLSTLVRTGAGFTLSTPTALTAGLGDVRAAVWQSATGVVFLATPPGAAQEVVQAAVDGSQVVTLPLPAAVGGGPITLAGASGSPILVAGHGIVEQLTEGSAWRPVARGSAPAAPG